MPDWKKNIFVRAITLRMVNEEKSADEIIETYVNLTDTEKEVLRQHFSD